MSHAKNIEDLFKALFGLLSEEELSEFISEYEKEKLKFEEKEK